MPYTQLTLAQLRVLLQNQLGAASTTFWIDAELNFYINETLRLFNALTGYWKTPILLGTGSPAATVANQVYYTIPSATLTSGMRVSFNGQPLYQGSLFELDMAKPNWVGETTTSGGKVPTSPKIWAPVAMNMIAIWPADAAGGNSLTCEGVAKTPILVADGDYLNLGEQELDGLLDGMQHVAVFKEGGAEFKATQSDLQGMVDQASETAAQIQAYSKYREWMGWDADEEEIPQRTAGRSGVR